MAGRSTTVRDRHRKQIARDRPPCALCGEPIDYELRYPHERSYVVDHIVPLHTGGTDTLDNKQPAHRACNSAKGARAVAPVMKRSGALRPPGE